MRKQHVSQSLRQQVTEDAKRRCGYCLSQQRLVGSPMTIDHLQPESKGGATIRSNLWLACRRCNEFRGNRTEAADPLSNDVVRLFNPRDDSWQTHFIWSDDMTEIVGLTPIGRATVETLRLNNQEIVEARTLWILTGLHPPSSF